MFDDKAYRRKYYQEHKELMKERSRKWRKDNPDKVQEYNREYYERRKAKKGERHNATRNEVR